VPGIHVCQIVPRTNDPRGECVVVANDGNSAVSLTGLELTDYTGTQQHVHVIRFPQAQGDKNLLLGPGEQAFVFTGNGQKPAAQWRGPALVCRPSRPGLEQHRRRRVLAEARRDLCRLDDCRGSGSAPEWTLKSSSPNSRKPVNGFARFTPQFPRPLALLAFAAMPTEGQYELLGLLVAADNAAKEPGTFLLVYVGGGG
jgi:hypothetical protein